MEYGEILTELDKKQSTRVTFVDDRGIVLTRMTEEGKSPMHSIDFVSKQEILAKLSIYEAINLRNFLNKISEMGILHEEVDAS